jgi:polar amino acid transport system substrate-binding protein
MKPRAWLEVLVGLALLIGTAAAGGAQETTTSQPALRTGVVAVPPLFIRAADGQWTGFSVDLWKAVARNMGASIEFREYPSGQLLVEALEHGEIDLIPSMVVRERFEPIMDFSQSYVKSGLAIAVPAESTGYRWTRVLSGMFSEQILNAIAFMLVVSLVAGVIVWGFERRSNSEMFGGGALEGIGHGVWWAMVTMATVGYGDKAPKTMGGRFTAFLWMIFSIVFIASFTANITTSLTLDELKGNVRGFGDLFHARVGSVTGSEASVFLTKQGVTIIPFATFGEGLQAIAERRIDAFVQDEHVLRYQVKNDYPGRVQVLPGTYDEYFVSIAVQEKSPLRKKINRALLKFMATEEWTTLMNRYFS